MYFVDFQEVMQCVSEPRLERQMASSYSISMAIRLGPMPLLERCLGFFTWRPEHARLGSRDGEVSSNLASITRGATFIAPNRGVIVARMIWCHDDDGAGFWQGSTLGPHGSIFTM